MLCAVGVQQREGYLPLPTVTYRYLPLSTVTYRYLPLSAVTCRYLPLLTVTYRYLPLPTVTYRYLPLPVRGRCPTARRSSTAHVRRIARSAPCHPAGRRRRRRRAALGPVRSDRAPCRTFVACDQPGGRHVRVAGWSQVIMHPINQSNQAFNQSSNQTTGQSSNRVAGSGRVLTRSHAASQLPRARVPRSTWPSRWRATPRS